MTGYTLIMTARNPRYLKALLIALVVSATAQAAAPSSQSVWPARDAVAEFAPEKGRKLELPEFLTAVERASSLAFAGRYRAALNDLYKLDEGKNDQIDIALVRGEALMNLGDEPAARKALEAHSEDLRATLLLARVDLRFGNASDAVARLSPLFDKSDSTSPELPFLLGQALERQGEFPAAARVYQRVAKGPLLAKWVRQGASGFESAGELTLAAQCIDRWATLTMAYKEEPKLNDQLLGMMTAAYDVVDREYWPARLAAAQFGAQRDDEQNAIDEFKAVLKVNPGSIDTLTSLGEIGIRYFQFELADGAIAQLRAIQSDSFEADVLEARNLMRQRQPMLARPVLERARLARPDDAQVIGLIASLDVLELREADALASLEAFSKDRPGDARPYFEVAEQLSSLRQYELARRYYQTAVDKAPWWTAARNGMGLMLTQSGDDDAARQTLEAARVLDPFNRETTNYLRLLDDVATYQRIESEHFVIVLDEKADPVIAQFMLEYMEPVHRQLAEKYKWSPAKKTAIEVFPTHDRFSVRTTGSPWIGTVGAATGPIIAMVSPREGSQTLGLYNWAEVLRHEYTHTITLGATNNRIAHWMTEGLAVLEEERPIRWDWVPMLYEASNKDGLFDLNQLTWAFVRPKRPIDRSLAYAQSGWLCRYLVDTYGMETILLMLNDFRDGKTQDQSFPARTGRTSGEVFADFKAWAKKQADTWGYDEASTAKYEALVAEAEQAIKDKDFALAALKWEEIAVLRPMDRLPHQRLAGLYLQPALGDPKKAVDHLHQLNRGESKDNRIAKRAARISRDQLNDLVRAASFAMTAVHVNPYDADAQQLCADIYKAMGDDARADRHLRAVLLIQQMKTTLKPQQP